jgi:hypothetical protein
MIALLLACLNFASGVATQTSAASKNEVYIKAFYALDEPIFL